MVSPLYDLPLKLSSYPPALREEVTSAAAALLAADPLPAGEAEAVVFDCPRSEPLPGLSLSLIGLSGPPRSGKDLLAEYLAFRYAGVERFSFSDALIDEVNGWLAPFARRVTAGNKSSPLHRKLLQVWGRARRFEDPLYWTSRMASRLDGSPASLQLVSGVRDSEEVSMLRSRGALLVRVSRPGNDYLADDPVESALTDQDLSSMRPLLNPSEGDLTPFLLAVEALLEELSVDTPPGPFPTH